MVPSIKANYRKKKDRVVRIMCVSEMRKTQDVSGQSVISKQIVKTAVREGPSIIRWVRAYIN